MADQGATTKPDPQALLTALTTEHFTLQGSRASTTSESAARSALYLGTLSSALISFGFIGNISGPGDLFNVFALVVLPTIYFLGLFTYIRLVESSIEDIFYGMAINRIRNYYLELAGDRADLFLLGAYDDPGGVMANMALAPSRFRLLFTASGAISVVNSVVGGSALALAVSVAFGAPLGVAVIVGAIFLGVSLFLNERWAQASFVKANSRQESLFPTPEA